MRTLTRALRFYVYIALASYASFAVSLDARSTTSPGTLHWTVAPAGATNLLGTVSISQEGASSNLLFTIGIGSKEGSMICVGSHLRMDDKAWIITFSVGSRSLHVTVLPDSTRKDHTVSSQGYAGTYSPQLSVLSFHIDADEPLIDNLTIVGLSDQAGWRKVVVPYLDHALYFSRNFDEYLDASWDWQKSSATALNDLSTRYLKKTNGQLNSLHEQLQIRVSPDIDDAFPVIHNPPSPYLSTVAGRTVLDIWDAGFEKIDEGLKDLADFGVDDCIAIIHRWQSKGYDNALPEHLPAMPSLGGDDALVSAVHQGTRNGCLMALHENYVDYYPNYPSFDPASISLKSDGSKLTSWLNRTTHIQSFATKPAWMLTNASLNAPEIHARFATTAGYLDVNSAVPPSWHPDMDAETPEAGKLSAMLHSDEKLWNYERSTHKGPVFGEGANHWYYSGLLDGVEAQLGAGSTAQNTGTGLPLFVDFDLLRIHPLQVNHGMGYYGRWTTSRSIKLSTLELDAYRMQEVAFGHAPFLGDGLWNDVPQALIESKLIGSVAGSYAGARVKFIEYHNKSAWVSSSAEEANGRFETVKVEYDNGLNLVANASAEALFWDNIHIPQYGWAARGPDFLAYSASCGSSLCDYAHTTTSLFANARNQQDFALGWGDAQPSVTRVDKAGRRSFLIAYKWNVYRSMPHSSQYKVFVHFVNDESFSQQNAGTSFQDGHQPALTLADWRPGSSVQQGPVTVTIPAGVADGRYSIRMGIFDPVSHARSKLAGLDDGTRRYLVGYLDVSDSGNEVRLEPPPHPSNDPRMNAAGSVVDFGKVQTDGMIAMKKAQGRWVLIPYPRYRNFVILLNKSSFAVPKSIESNGNKSSLISPIVRGNYWQLPMNGSSSYSWKDSY